MEIKNFTPRLYQERILDSCLKKNTLVVLPTGLGKTKIGILAAVERMRMFPSTKALFLTPTKPLAAQIQREFKECTDINEKEVVLCTGEVDPEEREKQLQNARVVVSTPQTVSNDVVNGKIRLEEFSLLVLDEAHRCVKEYAYTWLCKSYMKTAKYPRVVGLTASPGADNETISQVCKNAFVEDIEVRSEEDEDVKPYVQEVDIEWIKVDLPSEFKAVQEVLSGVYNEKMNAIRKLGMIGSNSLSKKEMLGVLASFQGRLGRGDKDFRVMRAVSLLAEALKVEHALEMLETQGCEALCSYLENLFAEAERTKVRAVKMLARDANMLVALVKARELVEKKVEHPKVSVLKQIVKNEVEKDLRVKIIIFNQYRDSAKKIEGELNKIEGVVASVFVGQAKKRGTGLSQKEQMLLLKQFGEGKVNCIVSTSIGEEGLDIPKVDLVVFFEPIPSAIRSIQRRGRTARTERGRVVVLMTRNTRDEAYHWVAVHKERNMHRVIQELKKKLVFQPGEKQGSLLSFNEEQIKVVVDARESAMIKELASQGLSVEAKSLDVADIVVSERVGIERKTVEDFLASMIDKRLMQQVRELRKNFERPLLVLEGEEDIYALRKIHPNAIRGMLAAIAVSYAVPIIRTKNAVDTALLIKTIARREREEGEREFSVRVQKKPLTTKELQEFVVESLPGVGPVIAKNLLKDLKSVKSVVNASVEELKKVEGLGEKKAKEIREVLDELYD